METGNNIALPAHSESLASKIPMSFVIKAIAIAVILGLVIYLINQFKDKFFGSSKDREEAKALSSDISLSENTVNAINNEKSEFRGAIQKGIIKKYGKKATPQDVKAYVATLIPNSKNFPDFMRQIWSSYRYLKENDASKIFNVFKNLKSQFEVNAFATYYGIASTTPSSLKVIPKESMAGDMWKVLDVLMHNNDMAMLREQINKKPLI